MGVARVVVAAAVALALASACSSGGAKAPSPVPATASPAPPTAKGPSTTPPAPAATTQPTPTTVALVPQQSPDVAARALFVAWSHGDRAGALHVATPAAAAALFARPVEAFSDRGCQDPISDRAVCAFALGTGLAQVGTVSLAGGWVVETVTING